MFIFIDNKSNTMLGNCAVVSRPFNYKKMSYIRDLKFLSNMSLDS